MAGVTGITALDGGRTPRAPTGSRARRSRHADHARIADTPVFLGLQRLPACTHMSVGCLLHMHALDGARPDC